MPALDFPRVTDFNSFDVTKGRELTGICNCAIVVMVYSGSGTYGAARGRPICPFVFIEEDRMRALASQPRTFAAASLAAGLLTLVATSAQATFVALPVVPESSITEAEKLFLTPGDGNTLMGTVGCNPVVASSQMT
jgi:hypothetical protein